MTLHVLIVCTHNSARSVLAEGMLNHLAKAMGKDVQAHSAGSAPSGRVHPLALEALQAAGVDTSGVRSKSWDAFTTADAPPLSIVITVCDSAAAEPCPVFFGASGRPVQVHWPYPDPSRAEGGDEGKRRAFALTRQAIASRMQQLLQLPLHAMTQEALQAALVALGRTAQGPVPNRAARRVLLLGASGTIGRATAQALLAAGHHVVCPLRARPGRFGTQADTALAASLQGAQMLWGDPTDPQWLADTVFAGTAFDAVVSCMASRTGTPRDAWRIDFQAHVHCLAAAQAAGVHHFVLLSALCVQKPKLAFQQAKLAFEARLIASGMRYSIVRPTAFFKSLSGQLERVKQGKPFLIFGDGLRTACKPISDADLGQYIAQCLDNPDCHNRILPIGGPGPAITPREQGEYLFALLGTSPRFKSVPIGLLDFIISTLSLLGKIVPAAADKAELARIGRYYATESMLVWDDANARYDADATPSFGRQTLFDAYAQWAQGDSAPDRGDHAVF